jgi:hypothetical protein
LFLTDQRLEKIRRKSTRKYFWYLPIIVKELFFFSVVASSSVGGFPLGLRFVWISTHHVISDFSVFFLAELEAPWWNADFSAASKEVICAGGTRGHKG